MKKIKQIFAYAIVDKKNPKIKVGEVYSSKKDVLLNKNEVWVTVIIKTK